jgi:hypothetical protein
MTRILKKSAMLFLGAAVFVTGFAWDGQLGSMSNATLISPAQARVGRPLTPISYAGVARRTTRRVVATTAVVAAPRPVVVAPVPAVVVVPAACTVVVDTYGRVVKPC